MGRGEGAGEGGGGDEVVSAGVADGGEGVWERRVVSWVLERGKVTCGLGDVTSAMDAGVMPAAVQGRVVPSERRERETEKDIPISTLNDTHGPRLPVS